MRRKHDWLAEEGSPPRTPLGHPVTSHYDPLSQRIQTDLHAAGDGPHSPCSAYRLQALYLDFGRTAPVQELVDTVFAALETANPAFEEASGRLGERLARLSRRALTAALVFDAHFRDMRLALEVVAGDGPLERLASGMCAFVAEQRLGRGLGGDPRYYAPLGEREPAFCYESCLPAIGPRASEDRLCLPERTAGTCGMLQVLGGFRFFASFPDEP